MAISITGANEVGPVYSKLTTTKKREKKTSEIVKFTKK